MSVNVSILRPVFLASASSCRVVKKARNKSGKMGKNGEKIEEYGDSTRNFDFRIQKSNIPNFESEQHFSIQRIPNLAEDPEISVSVV